MWWQNGKLWPSRLDAQEAMRARGEMGRRGDSRQAERPTFRERRPPREERTDNRKLDWKPKGEFTPAPPSDRGPRTPAARPKNSERPEWKPRAGSKPEWRPKSQDSRPAPFGDRRPARAKLDWTPKSGYTDKADRPAAEKRKWIPKAEYKKSLGIEPKKDSKWRPGGEHRDPKQKYKDAKKAKWTNFKQNIRKRWEAKGGKKRDE
jgi:hypothetical protein